MDEENKENKDSLVSGVPVQAQPQAPVEAAENETGKEIDIIEEAKKVRDENKKILEQLREERKKIERATAEIVMSGRSHAIPGKSPEDLEKEKSQKLADEMTNAFK